jgi:hypothetical protein
MSHRITLVFAAALGLVGCSSNSESKALYGTTFDLNVSAFGKTDPTTAVVDQGDKSDLVFQFTYGFFTEPGDVNDTGLQVELKGTTLTVNTQPIHVDHSTGPIDGTVTGSGTLNGTSLNLTLNVLPSDFTIFDANHNPVAAGTTVDYTITGTQEAASK